MHQGPVTYFLVLLQFMLAVGFAAATMVVTHLIGPKLKTRKKMGAYESGIAPVGNARQPFSIKYFLTAILFVLFDVEVIFLYPWALNFKELGVRGISEMGIFMALLLCGFFYIIKKGALDWD